MTDKDASQDAMEAEVTAEQGTAADNDGATAEAPDHLPEDGVEDVAEETAEESTNNAEAAPSELEAARAEAQKNLDGWQRSLAEFQNFKRRTERELKDRLQKGRFEVLTDLLPVVDDFERAMANLPEDMDDQPWLEGVRLIQRKFQKLLDDYDVVALDPVGEPFDPNLHQAIGTDDDSDADSGTVTETLQKGYMSGERVLRPALVRVAS